MPHIAKRNDFAKIIHMKIFSLLFFLVFGNLVNAQDTSLTTSFSFKLENLKIFFPENKLDIKNPKILNLTNLEKEDKKEIILFKYYESIYPLIMNAQLINEEITDVYIRFPNNFPHNLVLKNFHDLFGKHDRIYRQDSNALFTWTNKTLEGKNIEIIYHGACSLDCFPLGIYLISKKAQKDPSFISLYQKFNKDFPKGGF